MTSLAAALRADSQTWIPTLRIEGVRELFCTEAPDIAAPGGRLWASGTLAELPTLRSESLETSTGWIGGCASWSGCTVELCGVGFAFERDPLPDGQTANYVWQGASVVNASGDAVFDTSRPTAYDQIQERYDGPAYLSGRRAWVELWPARPDTEEDKLSTPYVVESVTPAGINWLIRLSGGMETINKPFPIRAKRKLTSDSDGSRLPGAGESALTFGMSRGLMLRKVGDEIIRLNGLKDEISQRDVLGSGSKDDLKAGSDIALVFKAGGRHWARVMIQALEDVGADFDRASFVAMTTKYPGETVPYAWLDLSAGENCKAWLTKWFLKPLGLVLRMGPNGIEVARPRMPVYGDGEPIDDVLIDAKNAPKWTISSISAKNAVSASVGPAESTITAETPGSQMAPLSVSMAGLSPPEEGAVTVRLIGWLDRHHRSGYELKLEVHAAALNRLGLGDTARVTLPGLPDGRGGYGWDGVPCVVSALTYKLKGGLRGLVTLRRQGYKVAARIPQATGIEVEAGFSEAVASARGADGRPLPRTQQGTEARARYFGYWGE